MDLMRWIYRLALCLFIVGCSSWPEKYEKGHELWLDQLATGLENLGYDEKDIATIAAYDSWDTLYLEDIPVGTTFVSIEHFCSNFSVEFNTASMGQKAIQHIPGINLLYDIYSIPHITAVAGLIMWFPMLPISRIDQDQVILTIVYDESIALTISRYAYSNFFGAVRGYYYLSLYDYLEESVLAQIYISSITKIYPEEGEEKIEMPWPELDAAIIDKIKLSEDMCFLKVADTVYLTSKGKKLFSLMANAGKWIKKAYPPPHKYHIESRKQ